MHRSPALPLLALAATSVRAPAQQLLRSVTGPAAGAQYGHACLHIGDQNVDGYDDLLVGAPGFDQERGAIFCLSGAFLATGTGMQTLWSVIPADQQGDRFGYALADVGDATGDGLADFLVGQPGFDFTGHPDSGAVVLVSGSSHLILSQIYETETGEALGTSIVTLGNIEPFDPQNEVLIGAPAPLGAHPKVRCLWGSTLSASGAVQNKTFFSFDGPASSEFGASLVTGFDLDGDGAPDFAVGAPGWDGPGAMDAGNVSFFRTLPYPNYVQPSGAYQPLVAGEHLGASIAGAHDYDGDGVVDIVAGAPNSPGPTGTEAGRVVVLSGARIAAATPPYELTTLLGSPAGSFHFGAAVCASDDLSGDGVGEILVGAPDFSQSPFGIALGGMSIFSGATGVRIGGANGSLGNHLGDAFEGTIGDLDGDGFREFLVAGSLADSGSSADIGVVKCYRLFPCAPSVYCAGKVNSLGCAPQIGFTGSASASSSAPFLVTATNFLNQRNGLLFYSHAPTSVAFQGGFKCAANPTLRTPSQSSGGSTSGSDCSGTYGFDFGARIASGVDPSLVIGAEVFAQYWSRDPASASHTSLSNALRFLINP